MGPEPAKEEEYEESVDGMSYRKMSQAQLDESHRASSVNKSVDIAQFNLK